jgi:molybdopterin-dependent oxidoreductase alpha subunit
VSDDGNFGPPVPGVAGIASLVPFGLNETKPRHFREAAMVVWENRDNLKYAWDVLNNGVCDGCSLGPRGLKDDVVPGVHVCMSRLKLLRQNTVGGFDESALRDISALRRMTNEELRELGRVPHPFVYKRGDPGFSRVSWDHALDLIAPIFASTPPERQAWFATAKGLTNEAYYAFTKAARAMGTNNVDFAARLCHQATVAGLSRTLGVGAPTVSLSDLIGTDLLLLWGTNLANNQPVSVKYLHYAKQQGTRIVVINSVREKGLEKYWIPSIASSALFGTRLSDDFVCVRPGGDIALMNLVMQLLVEWGAVDRAFIEASTTGYEALVAHLGAQDKDDLLRRCGVPWGEVEWLAKLIARARSMVTVYSMGLTQHRHGTQNVMGVSNLHLVRGMLGRPKCGILPIRGHSGVQGGGECGVVPDKFPGGVQVDEAGAAKMAEAWGFPVPSVPGHTAPRMVEQAYEGAIDVLYNVGGNLFATLPDPAYVAAAFARVRLRVHQDLNVNTSTLLEPGELVVLLPSATRYEQRGGGTSTSTERRIRFSPEIPGHRIPEARDEWEIPAQIVSRAKPERAPFFAWRSAADVRAEIPKVMPLYKGVETFTKAGDYVQWGGPFLFGDGTFPKLPDGRARIIALAPPDNDLAPGEFLLTNRRGKQFNSMVFATMDTLQGGFQRNDVFIARQDAERLKITDGQRIRLVNELGTFDGVARVDELAIGHLQAYWPEVNHLIPRCLDPLSEEPDYNTKVRIEPG